MSAAWKLVVLTTRSAHSVALSYCLTARVSRDRLPGVTVQRKHRTVTVLGGFGTLAHLLNLNVKQTAMEGGVVSVCLEPVKEEPS